MKNPSKIHNIELESWEKDSSDDKVLKKNLLFKQTQLKNKHKIKYISQLRRL